MKLVERTYKITNMKEIFLFQPYVFSFDMDNLFRYLFI